MINATHYIEVFKSKNMVKLIDGPCQPIEKLDISLKITKNSPDLKTLFVWKIRIGYCRRRQSRKPQFRSMCPAAFGNTMLAVRGG